MESKWCSNSDRNFVARESRMVEDSELDEDAMGETQIEREKEYCTLDVHRLDKNIIRLNERILVLYSLP